MKNTITAQITSRIFEILEGQPEGVRWVDLRRELESSNPEFHSKTVNGLIWKLTQKYPDRIAKTEGTFKLIK